MGNATIYAILFGGMFLIAAVYLIRMKKYYKR